MTLFNLFSPTVAKCDELKPNATDMELPELGELPPAEAAVPTLVRQAEAAELEKTKLTNPGLYEHASNELKRILMVDVFDGCRLECHKALGPKFTTSHTLWLGSKMIPDGFYQFGTNVVTGDPTDPSTILVGRVSPDGRVDARWHQKITDRLGLRFQSQLSNQPDQSHAVCDFDYRGEDFMVNLKISNGPLFGVSYFQAISNNLAVGGEGYLHVQHQKTISSYTGRYTCDDWAGVATFGSMGTLQMTYLRKLSPRVKLASDLALNTVTGEANANTGAEFTLRQSRFVTNVDHTGKISSSLETKISPVVMFLLSAEVSHAANDFKFGYGLQIGQ